MFVDAHAHIGHRIIVASAKDLVASMDASGVQHSMVLAGHLNDCPTEVLLADITFHRDRLHPIGAVSMNAPHEAQLKALEGFLRAKMLRAVKFYTGYEHFFPYDRVARPYLELLEQHGIPAVFHTGDCYCKVGGARHKYARPEHLDELAADMPNLKIVMAHMGHPWTVDGKQVVYARANVYADTSGFVCEHFTPESKARYVKEVRKFLEYIEAPHKLLFGTDWPIVDQLSYVEATIEALSGYGADVTDKVMGGNAAELYGITTG